MKTILVSVLVACSLTSVAFAADKGDNKVKAAVVVKKAPQTKERQRGDKHQFDEDRSGSHRDGDQHHNVSRS